MLKASVVADMDNGTPFGVPSELAVDCNLVPAVGDFDLGDTVGLAFKDRKVGDTFTLAGRLNTGDQALGAFDVSLNYDAEVLEVLGVDAGDELHGAVFSSNADAESGVIYINGAVDPTVAKNVYLFSISFICFSILTSSILSSLLERLDFDFDFTITCIVSLNTFAIGSSILSGKLL